MGAQSTGRDLFSGSQERKMTMYNYIKRLLIIFLSALVFLTVIMLCCVQGGENKIDMTPKNTESEHHSTESTEEKEHKHVFHSGVLKGVWVPYFTLSNGNGAMTQKDFENHFDRIIAKSKENDINALFVHVRSHCDAVFPSDIFPFSDIFTGSETPPDYDPLEYMITAAHNAGLEFHAWINPYRVLTDENAVLSKNSPCYDWANDNESSRNIIEYEGGLYLNPARAEVRSLIIDGVREIVNRYDVDGIHLDDYFYSFTSEEYDSLEYEEYCNNVNQRSQPMTLAQWRCTNVNMLISGIYAVVKCADEKIQFGISPQGNMENDIEMGADIYEWCSKYGYIDYIAPQIYYSFDNTVMPFEKTFDSWQGIIENNDIKLYSGLALYKAGTDTDGGSWLDGKSIITRQEDYALNAGADGYILYSWEYL